MTKSLSELLEKVELDEMVYRRYKVHDTQGNKKWEKDIAYSLGRCSWMASQEDLISFIEYIDSHKDN
jgi:hypothetical protein